MRLIKENVKMCDVLRIMLENKEYIAVEKYSDGVLAWEKLPNVGEQGDLALVWVNSEEELLPFICSYGMDKDEEEIDIYDTSH